MVCRELRLKLAHGAGNGRRAPWSTVGGVHALLSDHFANALRPGAAELGGGRLSHHHLLSPSKLLRESFSL